MYSLAEQQQAAEKRGRLTGKQFFQSQEAQVHPPLHDPPPSPLPVPQQGFAVTHLFKLHVKRQCPVFDLLDEFQAVSATAAILLCTLECTVYVCHYIKCISIPLLSSYGASS